MAEVLGVDRIKFADIVQSTFDARVRGTMGGFSETISELARRVGGCPHVRASCIGRGTASDILQEVAERYVFGAALDQPKVAGLPTWHRHGLFSGNAVVVASTWLKDVVDVVAFSCELGVRKPHPEMYLAATRRLNVHPEV